MTNMQRCEQGHFYDAARHRRCPACGIPGLDVGYTVPGGGAAAGGAQSIPPTAPHNPSPTGAPRNNAGQGGGAQPGPTRPAPGPQVTQRFNPAQQPDAPTVAFWHRPKKDADKPADAPGSAAAEESGFVDPVVGWLVAIDGPPKGRDFRLFSEGNTIGRNTRYRVAIMGDDSISGKEPHAILTYDPRSDDAAYFIQPAGTHLLYLIRQGGSKREVILTPTRLQPYDLLEMGKTKLLFVPLCNDWFRWRLSEDEPAGEE